MLTRHALVLLCGLGSALAAAQVPVVEAGNRGGRAAQGQEAGTGNELVVSLYNQLEALQQEVQTLRGIVEEQSYQLRRLQTEQRDRYLDIDRRLSELSGTAPAGLPPTADLGAGAAATGAASFSAPQDSTAPGGSPVATVLPLDQGATPPGTMSDAPVATGAVGGDLNEQDLYRTALNLLLEESKYEESVSLFQSYIQRFPQGRLLTNAFYWQGEALILLQRHAEARDIFLRLMDEFPADAKAPGAMLKLGVVYQQMGNGELAAQTWRDLATRYPDNPTEIRAAQDFLSRL